MVSAQCPNCLIDVGYYQQSGNWISCFKGRVEQTGAGGSSDGTIATAMTNNASFKLPLILKPAKAGDKLNIRFKLGTADGVDKLYSLVGDKSKSDAVHVIPVTIKDLNTGRKSVQVFGQADFGTATELNN